jgi:SEC-C motif-containing protein
MRSRYSAFATREVAYLWRTLHPDHEDRALPEAQVVAAIRQSCDTHRYPGLAILDRQPPDASGIARILFHARVFSRGKDVSFVELSRFAHDGKGWRYLDGAGRSAAEVGPCSGLTIAAFEARP